MFQLFTCHHQAEELKGFYKRVEHMRMKVSKEVYHIMSFRSHSRGQEACHP
jgi:hypothetical protein